MKVMKLQPFEMERWQSTWENRVEYNLAESGVHPLRLNELLDGDTSTFLNQSLGYSQTNGTEALRRTIAGLYPKSTVDDLLVTNGSSESNFLALWSFLEKGAKIVVLLPNYMQIWGLVKTMQGLLRPVWLKQEAGEWSFSLRDFERAVNKGTKLIAVCNPNNPTGAVMSDPTIDAICKMAKKANAWVLSDEVYQGAELDGKETPTFWGRYNKVIVTNGLSKAYGLPGLRVGWAVAGKNLAGRLWSYHDYTTIGPSALSDYLATKVLQPDYRVKILARTRGILRSNLALLKDWVNNHRENLSFVPPKAGGIAMVKYSFKINSTRLAERLLKEKSTLVVPGDHFGMDRYLRIGYGCEQSHLKTGLECVGSIFSSLRNITQGKP